MKIVCVDNYDRDDIDDILVCENVNEYYGKQIIELFNNQPYDGIGIYFRLVDDGYKLKKFEP